MKSGLRGGKPRDMATFKKGGTSRGAGAAKKGFDYQIYAKGGGVKKYEDGGEVDREVRRPAFATEMLPTAPQRRMRRRIPKPPPPRPTDTEVMKDVVRDMTREERTRKAEMPSEIYRKGGGVKMAGGGSCRGMGAATKGGKYTIK